MNKRFEPLFTLTKNLYVEDSPVVVSAGVLLKDTESGRIVVQMKFRSVADAPICALRVTLACVDPAGRSTGEVAEYQYLDLNVCGGEQFGSNKAILIPDSATRAFAVTKVAAVFTDGTTASAEGHFAPLPEDILLENVGEDPALAEQYRMETNEKAMYAPNEGMGLRRCPCGRRYKGDVCPDCGLAFAKAMEAYDLPALEAAMNERLAKENAEREEAQRSAAYAKATAAMKGAKLVMQYRKALEEFEALGDYRDSAQWAEKCRKEIKALAVKKMKKPKSPYDYGEAERIFLSLGDMEDCPALAAECHKKFEASKDRQGNKLKKFGKVAAVIAVVAVAVALIVPAAKNHIIPAAQFKQAEAMAAEGRYDEAIAVYEQLGDYKDAHVKLLYAQYDKAEALLAEGLFTDAAAVFDELDDFLDSRDRLRECNYQFARQLMKGGSYNDAIALLMDVGVYADAPQLLDTCYVTLAEQAYELNSFDKALEYYEQVSDLNAEDETYLGCVYQAALLRMTEEDYVAAVKLFEQAGLYEDSQDKRLEAMYAYADATKENPDDTTINYTLALLNADYEGAQELNDVILEAKQAAEAAKQEESGEA